MCAHYKKHFLKQSTQHRYFLNLLNVCIVRHSTSLAIFCRHSYKIENWDIMIALSKIRWLILFCFFWLKCEFLFRRWDSIRWEQSSALIDAKKVIKFERQISRNFKPLWILWLFARNHKQSLDTMVSTKNQEWGLSNPRHTEAMLQHSFDFEGTKHT